MLAAAIASVLLALGCASSHQTVAGVDGDERMVDVTDAQYMALCTWAESLRGGQPLRYYCIGTQMVAGDACRGTCDVYDWDASTCFQTRSYWRSVAHDCPVTVSTWARFNTYGASHDCYFRRYPPDPTWIALHACDPSDAGPVDAGGRDGP